MVETRKESNETSEQTWFGCPACDTVKMQTQPRQSEIPSTDTDPGLDATETGIELGVDPGADQADRTDDTYVSPLSYSS